MWRRALAPRALNVRFSNFLLALYSQYRSPLSGAQQRVQLARKEGMLRERASDIAVFSATLTLTDPSYLIRAATANKLQV
jgi:hypothetical protein